METEPLIICRCWVRSERAGAYLEFIAEAVRNRKLIRHIKRHFKHPRYYWPHGPRVHLAVPAQRRKVILMGPQELTALLSEYNMSLAPRTYRRQSNSPRERTGRRHRALVPGEHHAARLVLPGYVQAVGRENPGRMKPGAPRVMIDCAPTALRARAVTIHEVRQGTVSRFALNRCLL
jgi:hypothetical protein